MGYKQCLHVHTIYCDGKNTPEEMVTAAIEKGFDSIGFSGHSYVDVFDDFSMNSEKEKRYRAEIAALKVKYADQIKIFCGLEKDNYSKVDTAGFDYLLGAVHCMKKGEDILFIDWNIENVKQNIASYFDGDSIAYAKHYFQAVAELPNFGKFDILAHFDLVTKFCEKEPLIDQNDPAYQKAAINALEELAGKVTYFEVNTGAISRGYRTAPYPAPFIVKHMKHLGFLPVITSDCHDKDYLDCGYDLAKQLLLDCGFEEHYILTDKGFKPIPIRE